MKELVSDMLIWCLRKMNCSVILNYRVSGGILQGKCDNCYYYDSDFDDLTILDMSNREIEIPHLMSFNFKTQPK